MERLSVSERNELWDRYELGEREEISRGLARDESLRSIAHRLGRSPSTVSREVKINGGHLRYRATVAHRASRKRANALLESLSAR